MEDSHRGSTLITWCEKILRIT